MTREATGWSGWERPAGQWGPQGDPGAHKGPLTEDTYQTIEEVEMEESVPLHVRTDSFPLSYTYTHSVDIHRHFLSLCMYPEGKEYIHIQWIIVRGKSRSEPFCFSSRWQKAVAITTLWWIQGLFPMVSFFMHTRRIKSKATDKRCSIRRGRILCKAYVKAAIMHIHGLAFNSRCTVIGRKFHLRPLSFIH